MKTYKVTIANEASNYTSTKYNDTLNGFTSEEAASKAAKQALRDAAGELMKWDAICYIETLNAWVLANNGNWLLVAKVEETPETPNPDNTPSTMNANEIIASLSENQVRTAAARLLPDKLFDEYFTPELGNIALLRQILEDHVFEYDTTAAEIMEAAGATKYAKTSNA